MWMCHALYRSLRGVDITGQRVRDIRRDLPAKDRLIPPTCTRLPKLHGSRTTNPLRVCEWATMRPPAADRSKRAAVPSLHVCASELVLGALLSTGRPLDRFGGFCTSRLRARATSIVHHHYRSDGGTIHSNCAYGCLAIISFGSLSSSRGSLIFWLGTSGDWRHFFWNKLQCNV